MIRLTPEERRHLNALVAPYLADARVRRMASFTQHGSVSTLEHCLRVARQSYGLARRLHMHVNEGQLVAGALLHDFYLYDWHDRSSSMPHHATRHPLYAAANARDILGVDADVQAIIKSHMWPLPPGRVPRSREAWLVCIADKTCSLDETIAMRGQNRPRS